MPYMLKSKSPLVYACALYMAVVGFYTVVVVWFPMAYIWATYEDLIGEWVQFWSIVVALAISARLVLAPWRYRWFFLLLALSCFYVAMEEISWGQRLIGFSSPEFFRSNNLQGETNIHNFLTGPFGTTLKAALSYSLAAALAIYGLVYPAALRLRFRFAVWCDRLGVAAPPLYLCPYFATAAFLECSPFRFNEAEVAEVLVGLGLALMTVHYQYIRPAAWEVPATDDDAAIAPTVEPAVAHGGVATGLTLRLSIATAVVLILSAGTTAALYASPSKRVRIEKRLRNGVEKFAGRYARYEQWAVSIDLYERVLEMEPHRVSIMRKLANCSRNMGDLARFEQYIEQALAADLKKDAMDPNRASVNRSLARTYRMIGDEKSAQNHLKQALRIGLRRVKRHPASSSAAYSLGKTYSLMQRHEPALQALSKAFKLKPSSRKYRKAYYRASNNVF